MNEGDVEKGARKRVHLEPELELIAGNLDAFDRRMMAAKLSRWAHQLTITAAVLTQPAARRRRKGRFVSVRRLRWN